MTAAPLRVLVVDDEPPARRRLRRWLDAEPGVELVGECGDGADAVRAIASVVPDLVLLDVRMPELDGFGVIRAVGASRMPAVVFVTAFEDHAVAAFEVCALDYLVKPVSRERFRESLERVRRARGSGAERLGALLEEAPRAASRVVLRAGAGTVVLEIEDITSVEAAGNYLKVSAAGSEHLVRETLKSLERRLPKDRFARVHRSWIVDLMSVRRVLRRDAGWTLELQNGNRVPVGRSYRDAVSTLA